MKLATRPRSLLTQFLILPAPYRFMKTTVKPVYLGCILDHLCPKLFPFLHVKTNLTSKGRKSSGLSTGPRASPRRLFGFRPALAGRQQPLDGIGDVHFRNMMITAFHAQ